MIKLTAGQKLRAMAIERTRLHIEAQKRGRTELSRLLHLRQGGCTTEDYVEDEIERLWTLMGTEAVRRRDIQAPTGEGSGATSQSAAAFTGDSCQTRESMAGEGEA